MGTARTSVGVTAERYRAVAAVGQRLPQLSSSPSAAVQEAGFLRTLGGVDVYLALRARVAGLSRAGVDDSVAAHELQVVPAMRGCIYLVSRSEVAWALRLADLLSRRRRDLEHGKAEIRKGELNKVSQAVLGTLAEQGPLTTTALRQALPTKAIRSLGDAGKKVGISSTLPPALRELEFGGEIERTLEDGRLDTERYLWRVASPSPFDLADVPDQPSSVFAHFAELYLRWAQIGSSDAFATWCGLGKRDAATAFDALAERPENATVEIRVDDFERPKKAGDELRALASSLPAIEKGHKPKTKPGISLLPFEDNLIHLRGGPATLVEPGYHQVEVPTWGLRDKVSTLGDARHMAFRSIVCEGRIVGFWEFDPDAQRVISACFEKLASKQRQEVERAAVATGTFLNEQIGHGKSYSLDTDEHLRRRVGKLAKMAS